MLRPPPAAPRRPSRPLLMAETAVWVPYASPTHVRATASSTVDADLVVSVDGAGFASANLQDDAACSVDPGLDRHRHPLSAAAAHPRPSDAGSNAGPQSIVQLALCTLRMTSAARAVVAEP